MAAFIYVDHLIRGAAKRQAVPRRQNSRLALAEGVLVHPGGATTDEFNRSNQPPVSQNVMGARLNENASDRTFSNTSLAAIIPRTFELFPTAAMLALLIHARPRCI